MIAVRLHRSRGRCLLDSSCNLKVRNALIPDTSFLLPESDTIWINKPASARLDYASCATDAGSHRERVVDGKTGIVSGLTPEAMADSILTILSDNPLAERLGKSGTEYSKEFTWERSALKHLELYSKFAVR